MEVEIAHQTAKWRVSGFCGELDRAKQNQSWDLLKTLKCRSALPWLVEGDFNEILFNSEKQEGDVRED